MMRITLPGGVVADYSAAEIAQAIHILTNALAAQAAGRESDLLLAGRFVRWQDRATDALTATQCQIVRCVLAQGSVSVGAVVRAVWGEDEITEGGIRSHCSRITRMLKRAEIPFKLRFEGNEIYFEKFPLSQDWDNSATGPLDN